ncbi:MAG: ATP-binding protein [Gemmatimonadaceae bacterium]
MRGFLLTHDSASLAPDFNARRILRLKADSLNRLAADKGQDSLVRIAWASAEKWDAGFAQPALSGKIAATAALAGKPLFDDVRGAFGALLSSNNADFDRAIESGNTLREWAGAVVLAELALIGFGFWLLRRSVISQASELIDQQTSLEEQAIELESQAAELEGQTAELEAHVSELEASGQREHELVENARLLNRRLAEAQRVAQLGYWEIDAANGDVFWSDEMYRLAGLEVGLRPAPTDRFLDLVHPNDREMMRRVATGAVDNPTEFTVQYRLLPADAPMRTVEAKGWLIVDDSKQRKLCGTIQDITARDRLETQLRRSQKMDAIGQLAGGIAHDFNNMLTVIEGCGSLLLTDHAWDPSARELISEINAAANRAAALTRQLLAFSRQQVLQPRVVDVNEAIGGVETMLRRLIGAHIDFQTTLDRTLYKVKADPGQLEQVLMNLAVNARDAMADGGRLTLETANVWFDDTQAKLYGSIKPGAYAMLAVSDTGHGIAPHDLERIFDPFFTTKEAGHGTGLGLSTVHGIVEQSGGYITVYSEVSRGTVFKVYLPRATADDVSEELITNTDAMPRGTETILLVEDDKPVRDISAIILRRQGYTVIETSSGIEALRACEDPTVLFDLVVSDMIMPQMGGRELSAHVGRLRPGVPMLLMSGYTRDSMLHNAEFAPGTHFIEKPFTPATLARQIRSALDSRRPI